MSTEDAGPLASIQGFIIDDAIQALIAGIKAIHALAQTEPQDESNYLYKNSRHIVKSAFALSALAVATYGCTE